MDALHSRVNIPTDLCPANHNRSEDHPGRSYRNLTGFGSLALDDKRWEGLEIPDNTGFCGLTACSLTRPVRGGESFDERGWKSQVSYGTYQHETCDIVAFDSGARDEFGFHHGISVAGCGTSSCNATSVAFPPYTLFRLKGVFEKGEWSAPGGLRPDCRLLLVTATYKFPDLDAGAAEGRASSKLCGVAPSLSYGSRKAFIRGLTDILDSPPLTMRDEWLRPFSWTDRLGVEYSSVAEWEYVNGPARRKEGCTPGIRDEANEGKTLEMFLRDINDEIMSFFVQHRRHAADEVAEHAKMTLDELLAVRLYTGPGYEPINDFLRQVEKLSGAFRTRVAKSAAFTFAATVKHLCHAIRKLAAISPPEQATLPLYRGVRGELPATFWMEDEQGMVCAVDGGFMSTSKNKHTPIQYMGTGSNVLWEILPKAESDTAYHRGAEVGKLSQFAGEDEVLFPPCTLLQVQQNAKKEREEQAPSSSSQTKLYKDLSVSEEKDDRDPDKCFVSVSVTPFFV